MAGQSLYKLERYVPMTGLYERGSYIWTRVKSSHRFVFFYLYQETWTITTTILGTLEEPDKTITTTILGTLEGLENNNHSSTQYVENWPNRVTVHFIIT